MYRFAPILLAMAATPLAAQAPAPAVPPPAPRLAGPVIQRGDRVRLHPRSSGVRPVVGRWLGTTGGQVRLEVVDESGRVDTSLVSLETVALVERSTGRRGRSGAGMGIGAAIGLVVGGAAGFAAGDDKAGFFQMSAGQKAMMGGVAGAGLGLVIGGIVGATKVSDRWEVVPIQPSAAGTGPAVTFRF
jgi:hypothetical protein